MSEREDVAVNVGEWETRTDLPPIRKQYRDGWRVVEYLTHMLDRKVVTAWRTADGQTWGRWEWESGL